jgi:hypothetical protein
MKIKNLKLDIIVFDENHFSGTTNLSKDILTSYSSKKTIKRMGNITRMSNVLGY